jgi:DNA-binding NtrC family response regulator
MMEGNSRILIVDDDKGIRELLSSLVETEGFRALTAGDGEMALKMIRSEDPDLLLLDIVMPGMDGMEVLRQVKDIDRELPVVLITGYADVPGAVKAMKAGAYDYLPKPFNNQEVIRIIQRATADRGLKKVMELSSRLQEKTGLREIMGPSDAVGRLISC